LIKKSGLLLSRLRSGGTYDDGVLDWTLDTLPKILNYNYSIVLSLVHTVCLQFTAHAFGILSLVSHQSSGMGFQLRTFLFLGSGTLAFPQPQRLLTRSALTGTPS
jgi:hypothetical protein